MPLHFDMEDDVFQAHCQIDYLRDAIENDGRVTSVENDIVTIDLPGSSVTTINLQPVQHLLDCLRKFR